MILAGSLRGSRLCPFWDLGASRWSAAGDAAAGRSCDVADGNGGAARRCRGAVGAAVRNRVGGSAAIDESLSDPAAMSHAAVPPIASATNPAAINVRRLVQ
jgi:hypothetical protein